MFLISVLLIIFMLILAVITIEFNDLLKAVIASGGVSLIASIIFYLLNAPDVAMAEASIGAGLTIGIFIFALRRTRRWEGEEEDE
ncbi:MAG TPA: DUF4040 domain-containing protein [Candidatus Atribacteria bacterium]|nr:DUF4040 domain-containing protein [Candidatus Atribacteria bacterium]